ncbi:hypothetical protein FOMPIDRAFT_82704 [Fomitopsis schrenkii]|uniref:Uncharacterized protein n=1 Tax=Fomitopsis schrenkii TaxID=2126942 RepID=S8DNL1_FOMSC|nr:hypothetical protein FOMPIDRAFT_82704 [Fomitopsis schrenkii]
MATTVLSIHYRHPRSRAFKVKQVVGEYLDAFVNSDLEALGFPLPGPQDCSCASQSAIVKCAWHTESDLEMTARVSIAFDALNPDMLAQCSIGYLTYIVAPGVRNPVGNGSASVARKPLKPPHLKLPLKRAATQIQADAAREFAPPTSEGSYASARRDRLDDALHRLHGLQGTFAATSSGSAGSNPLERFPAPTTHPNAIAGGTVEMEDIHAPPLVEPLSSRRPIGVLSGNPPGEPSQPRAPSYPTSGSSLTQRPVATGANSTPLRDCSAKNSAHESLDADRGLSGLAAWENAVAEQPAALTGPRNGVQGAYIRREMDEIASLRAELKAESEARRAAENALQWERQRREAAERAIADLRQERGREPFVVPALVDAFVALSHATGKLLAEVPSGRKGL